MKKVLKGLREALAYARGDKTKARVTRVRVSYAPKGQCEHCDYRREKDIERVRRWRAKKGN